MSIAFAFQPDGISANYSDISISADLPKVIGVPSPYLHGPGHHANANKVLVVSRSIADERITVRSWAFRELHILIRTPLVVAPVESISCRRRAEGVGTRFNHRPTRYSINSRPGGSPRRSMRFEGSIGCLCEIVSEGHLHHRNMQRPWPGVETAPASNVSIHEVSVLAPMTMPCLVPSGVKESVTDNSSTSLMYALYDVLTHRSSTTSPDTRVVVPVAIVDSDPSTRFCIIRTAPPDPLIPT
jgi:hypothetical protein